MEVSSGKRRLVIREMELKNFKSYAGSQSVGPFHKSFSSVVGPNGSGKSNVIDAMLFVFGKRAKQLRLSKVSELIHNSTHHRNLDMAVVSVYFQEIIDLPGQDFEVVPGTEFTVSRTAQRNNKSDYYINDRRSNFTEVTDMLKGKGIDLDNNRFLILQGEVEQISMMRPLAQGPHDTGLLEYLEDIIGTDRYVPMLEERSKRLEELNEKRQGMVQRLKIVEKERDALETEKVAAEAYLGKQRESLECQRTIFHVFVRDGQRNLEVIEKSLRELKTKLDYEQNKQKTYSKDLKTVETSFNKELAEHQKLQAELDTATETMKEFERKDVRFQEEIKQLKQKIQKLEDKQAKDRGKSQVLEGMMEGIKDEVESLTRQLQEVRKQLAPGESEAQRCQAAISVASSERDLLLKRGKGAAKKLQEAKDGLKATRSSAAETCTQVAALEASLDTLRTAVSTGEHEVAAANAELQGVEGSLRD
ncbi:hypothetical protein WJX84_009989, partial [Apatococcus fuscideae]